MYFETECKMTGQVIDFGMLLPIGHMNSNRSIFDAVTTKPLWRNLLDNSVDYVVQERNGSTKHA